ncbi:hypothetical protein [Neomoorella mulderi]|uniref:Uncharacterized protein n=1 Tax=Moorella mulderi DSM 14980 TaxID=1122241 RepID=A0A151AYS8_9FIRM|nr:hypothetical protein [Moorella mulderi]KYH32814.1 hypothetical protein MOMUL_14160 [Moorella mulderi DSM 14980]
MNSVSQVRHFLEEHNMRCLATRCQKNGCIFHLDLHTDRLIIDVDNWGNDQGCSTKLCDYIILYDDQHSHKIILILIEMKSGRSKGTRPLEQIQSTIQTMSQFFCRVSISTFLPILLYGRRPPRTMDFKTLKDKRVMFKGKKYPLIIRHCGSYISEILTRYSGINDFRHYHATGS